MLKYIEKKGLYFGFVCRYKLTQYKFNIKLIMIRRGIAALRPLVKSRRIVLRNQPVFPIFRANPSYYFSTEKDNEQDIKTQKNDSQAKEPKLSELSVEDLIELKTQESLREVEKRIKQLEKIREENETKIKDIEGRLGYSEKHHADLTLKEEKLLENINDQEAELIRIKKRAEKELEDSKDFAITKLAKEIMDVADNVKRCKVFAEQQITEHPNDKYLQKIILCYEQMQKFLKLYDIEEFDPVNQPFDPNTSESLVTIPCPPGCTPNHVAYTMQTGYRIKSRLLRSARVGIFV